MKTDLGPAGLLMMSGTLHWYWQLAMDGWCVSDPALSLDPLCGDMMPFLLMYDLRNLNFLFIHCCLSAPFGPGQTWTM